MILNKLTARKVCRKQKTAMFNISPEMNSTVYESIILSKKYISSCLYLRLVIVEEWVNRSSWILNSIFAQIWKFWTLRNW